MKIIRDPVYDEYMEVDDSLFKEIIDTPLFQRLRRIRQTGFSSLYHACTHDRFSHSLGVYHLGKLATEAIFNSLNGHVAIKTLFTDSELEGIKKTVQLACLCHDIGHAPFSHTGEYFYLNSDKSSEDLDPLCTMLVKTVKSKSLTEQNKKEKIIDKAKPHEIMSAILAIKNFPKVIGKNYKEFFVRCITGYTYKDVNDVKNQFFNVLINIVNSSTIDVDRLDYLIRDAYVAGYDTAAIDYRRLLKNMEIVHYNDKYQIGYKKNAISAIESVIVAHDFERKWIFNHPVCVYENFILAMAISDISENFSKNNGNKLFSYDSLTENGQKFNGCSIALLCDDDIICYIKNACNDEIIRQFFARNRRMKSFWKSEAEFIALFRNRVSANTMRDMLSLFKSISTTKGNSEYVIINKNLLTVLRNEVEEVKTDQRFGPNIEMIQQLKIPFVKMLLKFLNDKNIFEVIVIKDKTFESGFQKNIHETLLSFKNLPNPVPMHLISDTLTSQRKPEDSDEWSTFFYMFYKKTSGKSQQNITMEDIVIFLRDTVEKLKVVETTKKISDNYTTTRTA